jgi:hypothetical protein
MLVDVSRLEREYVERWPDVEDPTQLVSFGTSVSEAQEIVNDALKSFDSAYQQRGAR